MFAKLSTLALLLPLVSAITLNSPDTSPSPGSTVTLTWEASTTDPSSFTIQLVNSIFHNTFAIASNVVTANGKITIQMPQVPLDSNYQLQAIAIDNVNDVLSQTGSFAIVAASSSSSTGSSTSTSTGTETASSTSGTHTGTATTKASATSASGTGTASATPSTFSSGATALKFVGVAPAAALVLSAVAGAVMVF